ncbi:MAG: hypothetical protein IT580_06765 [Verrucomicrobiales bacterium]|nr:hypothetical protein [Verrucomicrobiales bacterium]
MHSRCFGTLAGWLMLVCLLSASRAQGAAFSDAFGERETVVTAAGELTGTNATATRESGEPRHAHRAGGHSVWIQWVAPADGLAEWSSAGSTFDLVLAIYEVRREGTGFESLRTVVERDDDDSAVPSLPFPVKAGQTFAIAVDGYGGAVGEIKLTWQLFATGTPIPVLTSLPVDQSLAEGQSITLSVALSFTDDIEYRWFHDGDPVDNGEDASLTIPRFRRQDVGRYRVRIKFEDVVFDSDTVELQINSEGQNTALARNKLLDAIESPLRPEPDDDERDFSAARNRLALASVSRAALMNLPIGVVRGLNGTQIFSTRFGTRDPDEPKHCGVEGGASYWFGYQCIESGTLRFDTLGSEFPTVLAVYTFDPPLTAYAQLSTLGCSITDPATGTAAAVEITAQPGRTYLAVLDGVGGARGQAHLNYRLQRPVDPARVAPSILDGPAAITVVEGQPFLLQAVVMGSEPLAFQWLKAGQPLVDAISNTWAVAAARLEDAGEYSLRVSNDLGQVTSQPALVTVLQPPRIVSLPVPPPAAAGSTILLQAQVTGSPPFAFQWTRDGTDIPTATNDAWNLLQAAPADSGKYRLRVSNAAGTAISEDIEVLVIAPPTVFSHPASQVVGAGGQAEFVVQGETGTSGALQWFREETPLPGETDWRLVLLRCTPAESGRYQARLTNLAGTAWTSSASLLVRTQSWIAPHADGQTLQVGFLSDPGSPCAIEQAPALEGPWILFQTRTTPGSAWVETEIPLEPGGPQFVRCRILPANASSASAVGGTPTHTPQPIP